MIKIDYEKLLIDIGVYDALKKSLKEHGGMSDKDADNYIKRSIQNHGGKMNNTLGDFNQFYMSQKANKNKDEDSIEIDKKLDEMILNIQNNYKIFEKKDKEIK